MKYLATVRKIRKCEDEIAAQLYMEKVIEQQLEAAKQRELELLAVIEKYAVAITGERITPSQALREHDAKVLEEVISEWEKPYTLTDGSRFIDRLRRMAEERRKG